jgi:type VI protein secretion system component Hcp
VYTVTLRNATVSAIRQSLDAAGLAQEELAFSYQQATVTSVQGGTSVEVRR